MFLSCRPFVVNTPFSTCLVGVEVISVSWLGQLFDGKTVENKGKLVGVEVTSVSWLGQLFDGKTVENKGKLIGVEVYILGHFVLGSNH